MVNQNTFKSNANLFRSKNADPKTLPPSKASAEPSLRSGDRGRLISHQKLLMQSNDQAQKLLESDLHQIMRMAREQQRKKKEKAASFDWTNKEPQAAKTKFNDVIKK